MATTKRSKGGRATSRAKASARGRVAKSAKPSPKKKSAARPVAKAKPAPKAVKPSLKAAKPSLKAAKPAPKASKPSVKAATPTRAATKPAPAPVENAEVAALKSKLQRERNGFERRLTEAVREIGLLRHHELRAMQFERQLAERDATIERLQRQLGELERRPAEPVYVHEVQQTLALGAPAHHLGAVQAPVQTTLDGASTDLDHTAVDLDEFEDDRFEDGDLDRDD